jgi:hypothetical protein
MMGWIHAHSSELAQSFDSNRLSRFILHFYRSNQGYPSIATGLSAPLVSVRSRRVEGRKNQTCRADSSHPRPSVTRSPRFNAPSTC